MGIILPRRVMIYVKTFVASVPGGMICFFLCCYDLVVLGYTCFPMQQASPTFLGMSRLRCFLLGLDFKAIVFLFLVVPTFIVGIYVHGQKITYFLRPLWQSPPKPFISITHYYHENVSMETLCKLHGWGIREYPRRVYDAVLFSNEVDMLMIRWKELYPYITKFVLLESNSTFTALPKPLNFAINRDKFKFVEPRLTYGKVGEDSGEVKTHLSRKHTRDLHLTSFLELQA
ncbi:UNVERIFIED_CONTAM: hypothetical protein Slati_1627800 [Sesamum latifolium]|uniref:Uncharacterized protein n=1 Tax=Sesamum latifolium TaxID=2727402 RepID=A0AAW2XAA6_9LAMI